MDDVSEILSWSESPSGIRVELVGEIDFAVSGRVRAALLELIEQSSGSVLIDLGRVEYLDSSGLAMLIEARKRLGDAGRTLRVGSLAPQVEKLFKLTRVGGLFGVE